MPENEIGHPHSMKGSASSASPAKQWMTPRRPALPVRLEDLGGEGIGVAQMEDERQVALERQLDVAVEVVALQLERCLVPIGVEAALADGDDLRVRRRARRYASCRPRSASPTSLG